MNRHVSSLSAPVVLIVRLLRVLPVACALFLLATRVSAAPPRVDDAFPPPANAAERAKLEAELAYHPTPAQIAWSKQGLYGFIHFGIATEGVGKPENFNPTQLNCYQWVKACSEELL